MRSWAPVVSALLVALTAGSAAAGSSGPARAYVAASARAGDGSQAHPFATLTEALARGASTVFVAKGRYAERISLAAGQTIVGEEGARLEGDGAGPVLTASGGTVRGLTLASRAPVGVRIAGTVRLQDVLLEVEGATGVAVERGVLRWERGVLRGGAAARTAMSFSKGVEGWLTRLRIDGPFAQGILAEQTRLTLTDASVKGCDLGIRLRKGHAELRRVRVEKGKGMGVFVGPGTLDATALEVSGHEYGVLAGQGAQVTLRSLALSGNRRAGLAAQGGTLRVEGGTIQDSGDFGGVQLSEASATLEDVAILRSVGEGVAIVGGRVALRRVRVDGVRDPSGSEGEGILVRRARARLDQVSVAHVSGLGLYAAQYATVGFGALSLADCEAGSVAAEAGSAVTGRALRLLGPSASLIATRQGTLTLEQLVRSPAGALAAHCEEDAPIRIQALTGAPAPGEPCVRVGRSR